MALGFQRQGIFGRKAIPDYRSPWETPGYGDRMQQGGEAMPIGVEQLQQKPGFFQRPGIKTAAGILGDTLLTLGGGEPMYAPMMQQRKLQEEDARIRQQMFEQKRIAEREDKQWEWQNKPKEAPNNDTINDFNWYKSLPEEERRLFHQMNPVVGYMADGTPRVINPYEAQQPNLDSQPASEDGYDYTPGPGGRANPSNWKKAGGQAASPPATFRGGL